MSEGGLAAHVRDLYRQLDELMSLTERLIESERHAHSELQVLREARTFEHTMAAWTCPKCECFNGEERIVISNCRYCNCPRPVLSSATATRASAQE